MKNNLIIILFLLVGCQTTGKYSAPLRESCIFLAKSYEDGTDLFRCFCTDYSLNEDNFSLLYQKVETRMSNHREAETTLEYMVNNKESIITNKKYTLYGYYCRGYSAIDEKVFEELSNWAEENRVERIKCELSEKVDVKNPIDK